MIVRLKDLVMLLGPNLDRVYIVCMINTNIDEWQLLISLISLISDNADFNNEIVDLVIFNVQILTHGVFSGAQLIRITGLTIKYNDPC